MSEKRRGLVAEKELWLETAADCVWTVSFKLHSSLRNTGVWLSSADCALWLIWWISLRWLTHECFQYNVSLSFSLRALWKYRFPFQGVWGLHPGYKFLSNLFWAFAWSTQSVSSSFINGGKTTTFPWTCTCNYRQLIACTSFLNVIYNVNMWQNENIISWLY